MHPRASLCDAPYFPVGRRARRVIGGIGRELEDRLRRARTGRRGRSPTSLQEGLRRAHTDLAGGDGSVADLGGVCKELYGFR